MKRFFYEKRKSKICEANTSEQVHQFAYHVTGNRYKNCICVGLLYGLNQNVILNRVVSLLPFLMASLGKRASAKLEFPVFLYR